MLRIVKKNNYNYHFKASWFAKSSSQIRKVLDDYLKYADVFEYQWVI